MRELWEGKSESKGDGKSESKGEGKIEVGELVGRLAAWNSV